MTAARLVLAFVLLAITAGCGGTGPDRRDALADASSKLAERGTLRATVAFEYAAFGATRCDLAADLDHNLASMTCDEVMLGGPVEVRVVGATVYERDRKDGKWTSSTDDEDSVKEIDPRPMLEQIRKAATEISVVGADQVRGVETSHYHFVVDAEEVDVMAAKGTTTAEADAWIDEDSLLRRLRLVDGAGTDEEGRITFEYFDFGGDVEVEAPPADEVVAEEEGGDTGSSAVSRCEGRGPRPIDFDAFAHAIFTSGWADDAGPVAGPYLCDDTQITLRLGKSVACSLHDQPDAGETVQRRIEDDKTVFAIENASCAMRGDDATTERRVKALLVEMAKR